MNDGSRKGRDGSPSRPPPGHPTSHMPPSNTGAFGESALPRRQPLYHEVPAWVRDDATFYLTINCRPRGKNHLAHPTVAETLRESLSVRVEKGHWWPSLILLMPDHLHGLVTMAPGQDLRKAISDWKRYTARFAGIGWQRDFFDHRIRHDESLSEKWDYIVRNPVHAGLVATPEAWPYVWTGEELVGERNNVAPAAI